MPVIDEVMGNFLQSWWETDTPFLDNNPKNSRFYLQISLWVDLAYNLKAIFCWLLKMKVIYFLSFSVTDLVLENTEFRKKKKKGIFTLGQHVHLVVEALRGSVMTPVAAMWLGLLLLIAGQDPVRVTLLGTIWPPTSRNSSLTLSFLVVASHIC